MKPFELEPLGQTSSVPQLSINIVCHNNPSKAVKNSVQKKTVRPFMLLGGRFLGTVVILSSLSNAYS